MKNTMMRTSAALLAAASMAGNAWGGCISDADMAALKTAALQQELMVAAFSCDDIDLYNRFVRAHQPDLVDSDTRLKAYFVLRDGGRRGESSYHTYKTELANASSLRSVNNNDEFCARAGAAFHILEASSDLGATIDGRTWPIGEAYRACRANVTPLTTASAGTTPTGLESGTPRTPTYHRHLESL